MPFEDSGGGETIPPHRHIPHYHGSSVRSIFLISAIVLIIAQSTGAQLPLSTAGSVIAAVLLVVAAGITNPSLGWIHWLNAFVAIMGTLIFGMSAVGRYRAGISVFDPSFTFIEALAILSLLALYFTTRTIRGFYLRTVQ